mmetsp:Transcript_1760/g.2456  ORF Transcript_1760/g.2456 Transcript_1760/m.2456 type:complete len:740 (+) Transcript_1760:66-2285(+)
MLNTFESNEKKHLRKLEIERKLKEMERISTMHLTLDLPHGENNFSDQRSGFASEESDDDYVRDHRGPFVAENPPIESFENCVYSDEDISMKSSTSLHLAASTFRNICNSVQDLSPDNRSIRSKSSKSNRSKRSVGSAAIYRKPHNFRELVMGSDSAEFTNINLRDILDNAEERKWKRNRFLKYASIVVAFVVVVILLFKIPGAKKQSDNSADDNYSLPRPNDLPGNRPDPGPDRQKDEAHTRPHEDSRPSEADEMAGEALLRQIFVGQQIVGSKDLTGESPTRLAFDWILHSDLAQVIERNALDVKDWAQHPFIRPLTEQFALAVLYFSTQGPKWVRAENWMTNGADDICEYIGVECEVKTVQEDNEDYIGFRVVKVLNLTESGLQGPLPKQLLLLQDLEDLILPDNQISGAIPDELGYMDKLKTIQLERNKLTGTLPSSLRELQSLVSLDLHKNTLKGTISNDFFQGWASIESLGLFENEFTGTIPENIEDLKNLEYLYFDSNKLHGKIPTTIGKLIKLRDMRIQRNQLTGEIPSTIGALSSLEILYLDTNKLTGTLPVELFQIKNIEEIQLFKNELHGSLPEFPTLPNLSILYLDENQFTGTFPESVENLSALDFLFIENNNFNGNLPTSLGSIDLYELRVNWNDFEGPLPSEIGNLSNLEVLQLDDNRFSGAVPAEFSNLKNLVKLQMERNDLTGTISAEMCSLTDGALDTFMTDCAGDFPEIECECCTECANEQS